VLAVTAISNHAYTAELGTRSVEFAPKPRLHSLTLPFVPPLCGSV